ncbi:hypothetical protein, partial [Gordonia sp. N1V]|uniref:hypothetical protein n=1 Tax=Gordonia sp. N1V TaxID=3034163 RepID=UPI0023E2599D
SRGSSLALLGTSTIGWEGPERHSNASARWSRCEPRAASLETRRDDKPDTDLATRDDRGSMAPTDRIRRSRVPIGHGYYDLVEILTPDPSPDSPIEAATEAA